MSSSRPIPARSCMLSIPLWYNDQPRGVDAAQIPAKTSPDWCQRDT